MPIPASLVAALRALNSTHWIEVENGSNNIVVDGNPISLVTILTPASGGTTGTWSKDQIEGYNMLTPAQQTALAAAISSGPVNAALSTVGNTTLAYQVVSGGSGFVDTDVLVTTSPMATQTAVVDQPFNLMAGAAANNVPNQRSPNNIATYWYLGQLALLAGTITATQVLTAATIPS